MSKHARVSFTQGESFSALTAHFQTCQQLHMRRLFSIDPNRHRRMSIQFDWLLLDYSKNRITDETLALLCNMARQYRLPQAIEALSLKPDQGPWGFQTALRHPDKKPIMVNGEDIQPTILQQLSRMQAFTESVHNGTYRGFSHKKITDVVHIGMGHAALGPKSVCDALTPYHQLERLKLHFVSDIDGVQIQQTLAKLEADTTLLVIASESFQSADTLANATIARQWLAERSPTQPIQNHLIAITGNPQRAMAFGIHQDNIFQLLGWVDSRYAIWSSLGLPIMLSIGTRHFKDFLQGAHEMDQHFQDQPLEANMPVIMALIGIWYTHFFGAETHAMLPYDHHMAGLPHYIEQMDMQSHSCSVDREGNPIDYPTGSVIWSGRGLHNAHAFYQLLHRGNKVIPADFIVSSRTHSTYQKQHDRLFANAIAQTEMLMRGRNHNETLSDLGSQRSHRVLDGNNPSNTLVLQRVTPKSLGILLALYEHKAFSQSTLWNINPFEEWGISLGQRYSQRILQELHMPACTERHDASTNTLIRYYRTLVYPQKDKATSLSY